MTKMAVPIQVNLPDNWLDLVMERIKEDGDWQLVVRCKDCKHYTSSHYAPLDTYCYLTGCGIHDEDYCSRGERRTDGVDS